MDTGVQCGGEPGVARDHQHQAARPAETGKIAP
jgi:hypothetical protein